MDKFLWYFGGYGRHWNDNRSAVQFHPKRLGLIAFRALLCFLLSLVPKYAEAAPLNQLAKELES
mgnify:CR=1 FL=1